MFAVKPPFLRSSSHFGALLLFALGMPVLMAAPAATTTTLAVTANGLSVSSVDAGAVVTLTATVESAGKPVALGQVNFCDATAPLCSDIHLLGTVPLTTAGAAALKFVPRPGSHSYKAEFVSTVNDNASTSTAQPLLVYGATTTAIAQSGSPGNYTLKATVTGVAVESAPAGNVEFRDTSNSNAVLATAALGAGTSTSSWVNTQNPATPPQPLSIVVADFNGDGIPDIAIGTNGATAGYLNILLGNGNGTFQVAKSFPSLPNNQAMVATHFISGGALDILTVDNNTTGTNNAAMFIGNGSGGGAMQAPFSLGGLANVTAVAAGDFNRDGNQDFVITGVIYGVYCFAPVLGSGEGTFGGPTLNAVGSDPLSVVVGPFNTNGYPDIVVADSGANNVTVFQNNGQGFFFPGSVSYNVGTTPVAMATGDFNGDGFLDLAVVNNGSNNLTILFGHGNETLTTGSTIPIGHAPTSIAVGDFNGDGIADLAVVNSGDKTVTILLGIGDGTFKAATPLATGINPVNVITGDFSGTGPSDLVVTNQDIAATTGSTLTVQAAELTQTASATVTKVAPTGTGAHLVDAQYVGDSLYNTSTSATTSLTGATLPTAATPILSPAGGTYATAQTVTILEGTTGATIYYTTNGATPTTASTKYTGAIPVSVSETIHAIAVETGYNNSTVASGSYAIEAAAPTFTPAPGTYAAAQNITIADTSKGAIIYYTTTGATPTTASTKYTAPILVSASEVINAIAVATGYASSPVASARYIIGTPAATPTFSVAAGTYAVKQTVTITDKTAGATIYYTTNGTAPTTASTKYTAAISVAATETIEAIAVATGYITSAVATAKYTIETPAATPVFSPVAGTYSTAQSVKLTDSTASATIYYTINGTTPTTASTKYTAAIGVTASETIKAIAVATGYTNSAVATATYVIEKPAATPAFSVAAGTYAAKQTVTIADATPGAVIYYTTNGTVPTTASTKYTAAITVAASETIEAIAVATGYTNSAVAAAKYTIETPAATPIFSPIAGTYASAQSVKLTDTTPGATIYYTTNGTVPTTASTKYTTAITVAATETVEAIAIATGYTNSAVASAKYTIETPAATPTFSVAAGTYAAQQTVTIADKTAGAVIYYTTNGTSPTTASAKYTAAITVAASETIEAIAVATGYTNSAVASAKYTIETPAATPTFSVAAGTYAAQQTVTIADKTAGATIYYTTNGTTPTTASTKYTTAITVAATETLEAIAIANGYTNSAVASAKYIIQNPAATPTFSVAAGTYSVAQSVQISDTTPGATIYYTTNGAAPTPASAVYKSAVTISATGYLQAIAIADGYSQSAIASALYSIGANITATPVLSPAPGSYGKAQTVTITDATPGAVITYSVGIGSVVNTYTYTSPFTVSSTEYIAYDAIAPGYTRSAALEGIYTIGTVPTPQFSPVAGSYSTAQAVNIYDITPGATIYYTTDGTAPTTASPIYTGPILVTASQTLRALAASPGLTSSAAVSAAYTIGKGVATPTFSLAAGSYTVTQSLAISDITPGATIYYTTNRTTPTTASTKYTGPIAVATSETIEAIATATGDTNSAVATAKYTIGYPIATFVATSSGTNLLTIPVGGSAAFAIASENQSGQSYASITVKTTTGSNTTLPVQVTLCETNPSSGQCLTAAAATVTLAPFANGATPTFSVFVTATAAIASSPNNQVTVLFTGPTGQIYGSASVLVVTN